MNSCHMSDLLLVGFKRESSKVDLTELKRVQMLQAIKEKLKKYLLGRATTFLFG